MKTIYLLTTDHLEDMLWFREEEVFKVAMNYVAVQAAEMPDVSVLAFILMSNHAHFLLKGSRRRAADFVQGFKHRYSLFYRRNMVSRSFSGEMAWISNRYPMKTKPLKKRPPTSR